METGAASTIHQDEIARERLLQMGKLQTTEYNFDGAKVAVDYAHVPLQEGLQPTDKRRIAIYLPGLPHGPAQNTGGDPQEIGMVADLLTDNASDLIVLKPEGLTSSAYDNSAAPEKSATLKKLMEICAEQGIDLQQDGHTITVYGYSEGASQGASLALELQNQFGSVSRLIGIEPAGVSGYADRKSAHIWPQSIEKFRQALSTFFSKKDQRPVVQTDTGYHLSSELIASYSSILQHAGKDKDQMREYNKKYLIDTVKNVSSFIRRLGLGLFGLKTPRGVQKDRLRHVWSCNEDYTSLADSGIPITLFSGKKSQIAPFEEAEAWVRAQRKKQQDITLITSSTGHFDPNAISKGIGAALIFTHGKTAVEESGIVEDPNETVALDEEITEDDDQAQAQQATPTA
ncbi:hypothetical protein KBC70_03610 [Candidatus Woesebacteria bacterium]|nr:hypothetical protein [Candidatus Woesebacteria bacterium]